MPLKVNNAHKQFIDLYPSYRGYLWKAGKIELSDRAKFMINLYADCDIEIPDGRLEEYHWRMFHNNFEERCCEFCGKKGMIFIRSDKKFRRFCNTSCSARFRPNSTRGGFVTEEGREKAKDTLEHRSGERYAMKITSKFEKQQSKRYKTYTIFYNSGEPIRVQGYERFIFPHLLEMYEDSDLMLHKKDVPKIKYTDDDGVIRKYYPDGYIKSENMIIEVKSTYTLNDVKLPFKIKGVLDSGYDIRVIIYDKGEIYDSDIVDKIKSTYICKGNTELFNCDVLELDKSIT